MKELKIDNRILIIITMALLTISSALANTYTVTTTNDTGPGSLRAVITTANGVAGPHTISFGNSENFAGGGSIKCVSPLPQITQSVTIAGWRNTGSTNNAITVMGSPLVFGAGTTNSLQQLNIGGNITNGQSISISGCVITNGGIQSTGILQVSLSSVIRSPTVGIWNSGNATLNGVTVSSCSGDGIYNAGAISIASSQIISNNGAGGVYSTSWLQMTGCQIIGNTAWIMYGGGGVFNSGIASILQTTISSNLSFTCFGGGIYNAGQVSLDSCLLARNQAIGQNGPTDGGGGGAGGFGGGLYSSNGSLLLTNTTLFGNYAVGGNGGSPRQEIFVGYGGAPGKAGAGLYGGSGGSGGGQSAGGTGGNGGFASGGGGGGNGMIWYLHLYAGGLGGNGGFGGGAGGGGGGIPGGNAGSPGAWGGAGTTGSGRQAGDGGFAFPGSGGGGAGLGSAVFLQSGSIQMVNCTVAQNQAFGGSPGGHGAAAIYIYGGSVRLLNTLVATNSSATSDPPDVYGSFTSQGYNFVGNTSGSSGWSPVTDYQNALPLLLGLLQNNGGPTLTCALLPGSLCILAGTTVGAPLTDQRGVIRPLGECDIGAYQYTTLIQTIVTWTNPAPIVYSTPLSALQLDATANAGGTFTYIPPVGTVLNAGSNQVLIAIFTPSDPTSYTGATNTALITVLRTNQVINFPTIPPQTTNAPPIVLQASASSGLPVSYSIISGDALLAGNLLSVGSTPGQVIVRASQAGNSNFLPAQDVDQSFLVVTGSKPSITTQPTNQTVNLGGNAAFYVAATTSPLTYQWQFQSFVMPGQTNQTLSLRRVQPSQAGPYRVIVSNPIGSVTSVVAVLTVNVPAGAPAITSPPGSLTVRSGEPATFTLVATGNEPLLYQWYHGVSRDTSNPVGVNRPDYTTGALTNNTSYWVSVGNSLGTVDSDTAWVTVVPAQTPKLSFQVLAGYPVITLDGKVGTNYVLQYKNSLTDATWTPLLNFNLSANPFKFFDTSAIGVPGRYYRAYAY